MLVFAHSLAEREGIVYQRTILNIIAYGNHQDILFANSLSQTNILCICRAKDKVFDRKMDKGI